MGNASEPLTSRRYHFDAAPETLDISRQQPLLRVLLDTPGGAGPLVVLDPREGGVWTMRAEDDVVHLTWDVNDAGDAVHATIALRRAGPELLAELTLTHRGPRRVRQVQFPYVEWKPVHLSDSLLMASSWGDNIPRPCQAIRQFCDGGGNRPRMGAEYIVAGHDEIIYTYPSIMAMQHMVLHNPARALYLACYGRDDATKTFNAKVLGKYALALSVNHYPFLTDGEFVSPTCALALLPGGWHAAADLYGRHMRPRFTQPAIPPWMRERFHGWLEIMMKQEGRAPQYRYGDLVGLYKEKVAPLGLNVLKLAGWSAPSFDNLYPDYAFNPELGTAEELKSACAAIRTLGGRVEFYTNLRLVDPRSMFYRHGGAACVCVDEQGAPYIEGYNTAAQFRIACPSCPEYAAYFGGQVQRMISDYGAGAMQVDQVSCNRDYFCFDARHPHPTPATNYLGGLSDTLSHLRRIYKSLDDGFYVWAEGCHERFGQFYDVHQGHGEDFSWQIGESLPEHFSFVFPHAIVTGHAKTDLQGLCHSHAQGKPFDVSIRNLDIPAYAALLQQFVAVRSAQSDFFLRGTFRDSLGLELPANVRGFRINHPTAPRVLINLWTPGAAPGQPRAADLGVGMDFENVTSVYPADLDLRRHEQRLAGRWTGPLATFILESVAE